MRLPPGLTIKPSEPGGIGNGSAADIADLEREVVSSLAADRAVMRPSSVPAGLRTQALAIHDLSVLDSVTEETSKAIAYAAADPGCPICDANSLTVTADRRSRS